MGSVAGVMSTSLRLLIKLLESILKLCQILDLVLEHDNGVMRSTLALSAPKPCLSVVLELPHLVHTTDDFFCRWILCSRLWNIVWLVDNLDSGHIGVVILIVLEFHII